MIKIQGKDLSQYLTNVQLKLVRTYRGEIIRTQTGTVAAFPTSFITVGFDLEFLGPRQTMQEVEQILLSSNTFQLIINQGGTDISGAFSCTTNSMTEVRDKGERSLLLAVSVVNDGTAIKSSAGTFFTVSAGGTTVVNNCTFGKVYAVPYPYSTYKLDGHAIPGGKLLVLGNHVLTL